MRRLCRIWWPKELSRCRPSSSAVLFGWHVSCSAYLDIVVAFSCDEALVSRSQSSLQDLLHCTGGKLPIQLQEKSDFSIVGHFAADSSSNSPSLSAESEDQMESSSHCCESPLNSCEQQICGCHTIYGSLEMFRQASVRNSNWVQMLSDSHKFHREKHQWIPVVHHVHQNGLLMSDCDVHLIVYETPTFGAHHFSLGHRNSSEQVRSPPKRPKWLSELSLKQQLLDLDTIVLALNSALAAKVFFERRVGLDRSFVQIPIARRCFTFAGHIFVLFISLLSTLFYVVFQCYHSLISCGTKVWVFTIFMKLFSNSFQLIEKRSLQILYWPVFLQVYGIRSQSCVEYAEKLALRKHSTWSSITVDVFLGSLIGLPLLYNAEAVCSWALNFANDLTDNVLRMGCVWLMGVPAGFKLNIELAGVFGMLSLHIIQIWSTLWFFVGFCIIYLIKGLAISGILFGATIPAAVIIDLISLTTLHIAILHWLISLVYSWQIQALAALWRLFRGRKWNPLRKRLDSYQYTVEQHIVGSLLFTPVLLLLPTTTVFYIFFTIVNTSFCLTCMLIEIMVSIIHATPYAEILVWMVSSTRFPSGIWFEILSCQKKEVIPVENGKPYESGLPSERLWQKNSGRSKSDFLVSFLHSNTLSIGHIVLPHYRQVFARVSGSFAASLAYGLLTGRARIPYTLGIVFPLRMPWMSISCKEYWSLCRGSVLACLEDRDLCQFW